MTNTVKELREFNEELKSSGAGILLDEGIKAKLANEPTPVSGMPTSPTVDSSAGVPQVEAPTLSSPVQAVVDAYTMSALGNGNPDKGADVMDNVVESIREKAYGTNQQPNEISGLAALRPMIERV
jgi:hypothetical protein